MFQVGDVVGSYTILAHLRSGGMADLFLAHREGAAGFRRLVAIKVVHQRHAEDKQLVRMFLDEARISARIDHPNVVHVEDLGELDDTYFLVMEYVHGCSLAQLLRVLGKMQRRLSPMVAVAIAARVAEGLHAAHETTDDDGRLVSLVHRDVSPQNILLSHKGHVKLIDFGVAKARLRSEETNVAMLKGKVRYMPPEQATTGLVDRRSDVYSLGIVLWEMLTMRRLFSGRTEFEVLMKVRAPEIEPPSKYVEDVPPELDSVVLAALAAAPDQRPQSAKIFRRMLARAAPRSMTLDSAHLADLMASVVGEELQEVRHELPREVSRVLEAEQLRAALGEQQERSGLYDSQDTLRSAVDYMTVHTELAQFEEDELDETPDRPAPIPFEPQAKPGRPVDAAPSKPARRAPSPSIVFSSEAAALGAPTEEDADPTLVGQISLADALEPESEPLEESTTPTGQTVENVETSKPRPKRASPFDPPPTTSTRTRDKGLPLGASRKAVLFGLAFAISVLVGSSSAVLWIMRTDGGPAASVVSGAPPHESPPIDPGDFSGADDRRASDADPGGAGRPEDAGPLDGERWDGTAQVQEDGRDAVQERVDRAQRLRTLQRRRWLRRRHQSARSSPAP